MFKKMGNKTLNNIEKYLQLFNEHINDEKDYVFYNQLYCKIKEIYYKKLQASEIDIKSEKARLQDSLGRYKESVSNVNIQLAIGILTIVITNIIQAITLMQDKYRNGISILISIGVLVNFLFSIAKAKDKEKDFIYGLSLTVLEDIENEMQEERAQLENKEDKMEESAEPINTNDVLNTLILPAIFEVAASAIKKDGLVRKLFRKKKK
jgi:hypothetical protein